MKKLMGIVLHSYDWRGKPPYCGLKLDSRNSFVWAGSDGRNTVQAGRSVLASP